MPRCTYRFASVAGLHARSLAAAFCSLSFPLQIKVSLVRCANPEIKFNESLQKAELP